jgi:hypothetical protein
MTPTTPTLARSRRPIWCREKPKRLTYNLTITATAAFGFLAITPAGATGFAASAINWSGPNQDLANRGTVPVSASREVTVWGGFTGSTQFIIDVTGYYN